MTPVLSKALAAGMLTTSIALAAPAGIALVGKGSVPGSSLDRSGLDGLNCQASDAGNCVPDAIAEKIEALSWGPDLENGHHLLYVVSDNDLNPNLATQIFAFSIAPSLLDFRPQAFGEPLFPPGQVKKALKGK